jgi:hypothetical protein
MSEWLIEPVLKTGVCKIPQVRILLPPTPVGSVR